MSVYEPSRRRTKAELEDLEPYLAEIAAGLEVAA